MARYVETYERDPMMTWAKKSVRDSGGFWTDYVDEDANLLVAQGYDEWERKSGKPWALFRTTGDRWELLGFFATAEEAKSKTPEEASPAQQSA